METAISRHGIMVTTVWAVLLATVAGTLGYSSIADSTVMFVLLGLLIGSWPGWILAAFLLLAPGVALYGVVRASWQGRLRALVGYALVPALGVFGSYGTFSGAKLAATHILVAGYLERIEQARESGNDVDDDSNMIRLGPPITALFPQPGLMFVEAQFIGYDETDRMDYRAFLESDCEQPTVPLGHHFFRLSARTDCDYKIKKSP